MGYIFLESKRNFTSSITRKRKPIKAAVKRCWLSLGHIRFPTTELHFDVSFALGVLEYFKFWAQYILKANLFILILHRITSTMTHLRHYSASTSAMNNSGGLWVYTCLHLSRYQHIYQCFILLFTDNSLLTKLNPVKK